MDIVVDLNTCNICVLRVGGSDETSCPGHYGINPILWNQKPEFREYQQYLVNKKRQQAGLPPIEFQMRTKNFSEST